MLGSEEQINLPLIARISVLFLHFEAISFFFSEGSGI